MTTFYILIQQHLFCKAHVDINIFYHISTYLLWAVILSHSNSWALIIILCIYFSVHDTVTGFQTIHLCRYLCTSCFDACFFFLKAYHAACTLPSLSVSTRHVPIMLCGSCSQIHAHRYWFSSQLSFFPSVHPFIYLAKPLPLGVRREPARSLCERTQWIRHERRSPHNLDLFSFICYLSGSAAPRLSIILLCVGCMRRYACVYLCCLSIRPCKHSIFHRPPDPFFCVNNNTPANHGQTERRMLEKDYIQPVTRRTPNPACRQSEVGKGRDSVRERESVILTSFPPPLPLHLYRTEAGETITRPTWSLAQVCALPVAALPTCPEKRAKLQGSSKEKLFMLAHYLQATTHSIWWRINSNPTRYINVYTGATLKLWSRNGGLYYYYMFKHNLQLNYHACAL